MLNFINYQWVGFVSLYWGLRLVKQQPLSQSLSTLLLFILCCIVSWILIAKIAKDVELVEFATSILPSTALSFLLVLLSQVAVILWVFVEFEGIEAKYVIRYLITTYAWQIIIAVLCLCYGRYMRQSNKR